MRFSIFLFSVCVLFGGYGLFEVESFDFEDDIIDVQRHYVEERWIYEVECSTGISLLIDGTVIPVTRDLESNYDIASCGDSIVIVEYSPADSLLYFRTLYPHLGAVTTMPGLRFGFAFWLEDMGEIVLAVTDTTVEIIYYEPWLQNTYRTDLIACTELEVLWTDSSFGLEGVELYESKIQMHLKKRDSSSESGGTYGPSYSHDYDINKLISFNMDSIVECSDIPYSNGVERYSRNFPHGSCFPQVRYSRITEYELHLGKGLIDFDEDGIYEMPYTNSKIASWREYGCDLWTGRYLMESSTNIEEETSFFPKDSVSLPYTEKPPFCSGHLSRRASLS